MRSWRARPWHRDFTIWGALMIAIASTAMIVHHGLVAPWAQQLMEAGR